MKKKGKKNLMSKEIEQLSMMLKGRDVVLQERNEEGTFVCRAAFDGISAALFGATGKGETPETARSMARQNLAGVFAGSMLHAGLLKDFKATRGVRNAPLINLCQKIFDNAEAVLKKPEFECLLVKSRIFPPHTDDESIASRAARKEILGYAKTVFADYDRRSGGAAAAAASSSSAAPLLPPPPPPPAGPPPSEKKTADKNRKRTMDEPSTSNSTPILSKKKRVVVVEEESDDCIVVGSSSDSSDGDDDVVEVEVATLGNTVRTPEKKKTATNHSTPNSYLDTMYSEFDLLGVTEWNGARNERRRVEEHKKKFSKQIFSEFDESIWRHYKSNGQDDNIYNWKMAVRMKLLEIAQKIFPGFAVNMFAVGSTINGCGSYNSDMDLCLVVYDRDGSITEGQEFAKRNLNKLFNELKRNRQMVEKCQFIRHAVVPIIKLETKAPNSLEVDINMNNIAGVYNSHLMHYYARVDDRFAALCLIVKHWAINAGINDSLCGTFNSYSLILLVLHYLQCGVVPAILPNLQFLYHTRFGERPELSDLNLFGEFTPPLPQRILNEQSVGEVLIGFFEYYSRFDFTLSAISIRKGMVFPRSQLPAETTKAPLFIEEPFDGKNTARCVRREYMGAIRTAFQHGAESFRKRTPDLAVIDVVV